MSEQHRLVRDRNVATVEAMYQSERVRDLSTWVSLWHPEGRQSFPSAPASTVAGIDRLTEATRRKFEVRPPYEIHVVTEPFHDPSRVLARLRLETPHARWIADVWCVFQFDDAGQIMEVEEVVDSAAGTAFPR